MISPDQIVSQFLEQYYANLAKQRGNLQSFYAGSSVMRWEKNEYTGQQQIMEGFSRFGETELAFNNMINTFQIVLNQHLLILVNGTMSIDGAKEVPFVHSFLLINQNGCWFIANETFRFAFTQ